MKLNIICIGNLQKDFKVLYENYAQKLKFFVQLNLIEIKEAKEINIKLKIQKETNLILAKIPKNSKVVLCSLQGISKTSEQFSQLFDVDNLTFVIGGSNGVDESHFLYKINFSPMTFPHQLFRVMLIEQIYRAFTIKNNVKYHK